MAPPTKYARLEKIDPEALANEVVGAVQDHVQRLAFELCGSSVVLDGPPQLLPAVRVLAHYARFGGPLDAPVQEYLISIAPPVWMRAADMNGYQTLEYDRADPDMLEPTWLGSLILVMRGAIAREKLDNGEPLAAPELAILASMAGAAVRLLCSKGEIPAEKTDDGWVISANDAKTWLKARGQNS